MLIFGAMVFKSRPEKQSVIYRNLENIHNSKRPELIAELEQTTGLEIQKIKIREIDLENGVARLVVYYKS